MAARLRVRKNGVASFVTTSGKDAWHREGTVMPKGTVLNAEEFANLSGMSEITAKMIPMFYEFDGKVKESDVRAIINTQNGDMLGNPVTASYSLIDYSAPLGVCQALSEAGLAEYANGITLGKGEDAVIQMRMILPNGSVITKGDREVMATIAMNHGGQAKDLSYVTLVETVCWNTFKASLVGTHPFMMATSHRGNATERYLETAKAMYSHTLNAASLEIAALDSLKNVVFSNEEFATYVLDVVLPINTEEPKTERGKTEMQKRSDARSRLFYFWTDGIGMDGSKTAYNALQAVTQATSHEPQLFTVRDTGADWLESLVNGRIAEVQTKVAKSLQQFVTV